MKAHLTRRTIRRYADRDVSEELLSRLLNEAARTQTMGNLQLYSVIVTRDPQMKQRLAPAHFNQPMVTQAPIVLTICADFNRTTQWCRNRKADPGYDNLLSYQNAATDALLYTQTLCCLMDEEGLGYCYLGTTVYQPQAIIDALQLPSLVMPVATLTVGWPAEEPPLSDRLPVESFVHQETYRDYTPEDIDTYYNNKEQLPENQEFVRINQKETLAQVFTDIRYTRKDNEAMSEGLLQTLKRQGFLLVMLFSLLLSPFSFLEAYAQSWTADNGNGTYTNPLFYDEFSDPDILRVGDDYYLAGTTMHSVPGLVILHSRDLVNWENISYCFDRFDFPDDAFALKNHKEIYGQGIWAPCIRYNNGQFYIYSNINGKGLQCYTSKDIRGPWKHQNMQGRIYDLSVLFDDDGKIYAIHGYGEVHCTELKPDMSGPKEETDRIIIPEGSGVGEGHHMYKIDGMYYLISTDYMPNGRTLCSRSKNIWGPYETRVITADETFGYHAAPLTQVPQGEQYRIGQDGTNFGIPAADKDATACSNIHQGGIVQDQSGQWWALLMMDFHSIGRTTTLAPITWKDGWPMLGLEGNLGRAPRTWFKPNVGDVSSYEVRGTRYENTPHAPYVRSDDFNYSRTSNNSRTSYLEPRTSNNSLSPIWQWNHNPDDSKWSLKNGRLRIQAQPAEQLMWARNTLTQRVIGPRSIATVELYTKGMKDGDICGLGNINVPCSWIGISLPLTPSQRGGSEYLLRCFEQAANDTTSLSVRLPDGKIWLRCIGDYDNDKMQYAYSTDGETFQTFGQEIPLSYQLITFQGSRHALFAFNCKGKKGGYAEFDNFTVVEPDADRSGNIPYDKTFRIINKASGKPMIALDHGVVHDIDPALLDNPDAERDINNRDRNTSEENRFRIIDRGQGRVILQCEDGRYIFVAGEGLPGDVRLTTDPDKAEVFLWQDYLNHDFMLLSLRNHRYIGKSPTTGSPYSMDFPGADPARRNGAVLHWEE